MVLRATTLPVPSGGAALTVAPASEQDLAAVVELGAHFHEFTAWADHIEYDPDGAMVWAQVMQEMGLLVVAKDGDKVVACVGGIISPFLNNPSVTIGTEVLWWVEPEYRNAGLGNRLMSAIEQAAKDIGVQLWCMVSLEAVEPEKAGAIYEAAGYRLTEHTYMKEL